MKVPVPMIPGGNSGAAIAIAVVLFIGVVLFAAKYSQPQPGQNQQR